VEGRSEGANTWLGWARAHANGIDPLSATEKSAKRLDPNI
jgi:hypothetical protein